MLLKKLNINMFRNIRQSTLQFNSRFNLFYGKNGQGKTNYLESIFFLGTLKSFRNAKQKEMLSWNEPVCNMSCSVIDDDLAHDLVISFESNSKTLKVDSKPVKSIVQYSNTTSVIAFSPEEITMINGSPDQRRRYLDRAIFSSEAGYLKLYHDYYRVLKHRNQLLRQRSYAGIEAWTDQLAVTGAKLSADRFTYIDQLEKTFPIFYKNISGSDEDVRLCYHNFFYTVYPSCEEIQEELFRKIIAANRSDRERGTTTVGPHRDDLGFYLNGRLIREHGSQGQQKSFILALKMAEIDYLSRKLGKEPLLLLDDMTAELDTDRIEHLINFLISRKMQVFITTTDPASVPLPAGIGSSGFLVENGGIV